MQIRYYQEESVLALYSYFAKSTGNPIIALPTGTGKSVVIAEWLRSIFTYFPGQRVMILTHVKELIAQNYKKLINVWPLAPAGIYSAGLGRKEVRPITFAGIASVVKKAADFSHVDMVIIDECHLVSPHDETSYQNFIADLKKVNPHLKVIGLTATPYRLGQGLLTMPIETSKGPRPSLFSDICYDMTGLEPFNRLIAEGFLCQLIPKRVKAELDVSRVKNIGGDYNLGELQLAVDREEITRRALDEAEVQVAEAPHASGKARVRWLVFATGIEHTEHVARELTGRGYKAFAVHSKTPEKLRDKAVEWFTEESDDLRIIVNNGVFTTGFDCPHLDVIIMLRPTNSPGLWVQMLGRGTRPYPGKDNCLVLDFAGNTKRLGPINDPIIPKRKGKKGGGDAPVKVCEACGCYNHASVRFCINCNTEFPKAVKFKDTADTAEVVKGSAPVIEIFPVSHVEYAPHFPPPNSPKPPSLKVTYSCGKYQKFSEWVCLEHGGYVEGKARHWWAMSTKSAELRGPPKTVEEALTRLDSLREPSHIRVWMNDRHPRVMDRDFSGTAFNTAGKPEKLAT